MALREREGGRPFFEPDILTEAGVHRGLLFAGTDHAFNLAFDPAARDAEKALVVARSYGDDRDRLVWESHGRPAAYRYVFNGESAQLPKLIAWEPPAVTRNHRYEAEAEWPPLEQSGGYLEPVFATGTCASGERLLAIHPVGGCPLFGAPSRFRSLRLATSSFGPWSRPAKPSALGSHSAPSPRRRPRFGTSPPPANS